MQFKDRPEADTAHANGAFIPGAADFVPRWQAKAAEYRTRMADRGQFDLSYGEGERRKFDLFLPDCAPKGLLVFVHGGYWLAFGHKDWSHLAAGAIGRGWACAMPSYTLAPAARIAGMTVEIATAIAAAGQRVAGPIVVAGHSAGGHLAARMACQDQHLPRIARVLPISPLSDLSTLAQTSMNDDLRLDQTEISAESPALLARNPQVQAHVWVGGQERPLFLWQARVLSENWACPWTVEPDRHHFDVIDGLENPQSALMRACLDGLG